MSFSRMIRYAMSAIALVLVTATGSIAATAQPGVARVSVVRGTVEIERADSGDRTAATVNAPLEAGDYLATREDARAEVEFGFSTALRLAPATSVRFVALENERHRVQLSTGTLEVRLARGTRAHAEIETPQATIRPTERGRVRIAVARDGATTVTVRSGRADVVTDSGTQHVEAGAALAIAAGDASVRTLVAAGDDDFDRWTDARDRTIASATDDAYVDDAMVGSDELGAYGRWIENPRYGRVWSPYESAGWAPYHDGRFVYEPYYGWTWVAAEPWGWAPYHYGNWFYTAGSGWCWYPGAYAFDRPFVYRPAIVAFFSFGGGGANFGFGNIGWVPLAPYETFAPWYGNVTNVTVINNTTNVTVANALPTTARAGRVFTIYHNANAPGGAVALDRRSFADGNFVKVRTVTPATATNTTPVLGAVPIRPAVTGAARAPGFAPSRPIVVYGNASRDPVTIRPDITRPYLTHPVVRPVAIDRIENRPAIVHPGTLAPGGARQRPSELARPSQAEPSILVPSVRRSYEAPRFDARSTPREENATDRNAETTILRAPSRTYVVPQSSANVRATSPQRATQTSTERSEAPSTHAMHATSVTPNAPVRPQ